MGIDSATFARELARRLVTRPRWEIVTRPHDGDRRRPLAEVDQPNKVVTLNLHEGQMRAWSSEARMVFMIAGTQSGKTSFSPWMQVRDVFARGRGDYLAVTSSYDLFKLKLLPEILNIWEHLLGLGRYWAGDQVIEVADPATGRFLANKSSDPMWARIILRSAVAKGGLESTSGNGALIDEYGQDEFSWHAFQAIRRRVSLSRGRIYGGTTPYNLGWLKQQIYDKWERHELDYVDVIQWNSLSNPVFSAAEYDEARSSMQDWEFRMMYGGLFERPAGQIYSMFVNEDRDQGGHLVKRFVLPVEWPRFEAVDPGIINTAKLWAAHDPVADVFYVYREWMGERMTAKEHARMDLELERASGERVVKRGIGAPSEKYWREDYRAAGAQGVTGPDINDVEEGISRVVLLLKQFRLYFFDDLDGTLDEVMRYARVLDEMGQPTDKIKDKSTFHLVDALRYLAILLVKGKPKSAGKVVSVKYGG